MKKLILAIALFAIGTTVSFAQTAPATTEAAKTEQQQRGKAKGKSKAPQGKKKAPDMAEKTMYGCPMKCEAPKAEAGKCGVCKMDLVALKPKKGEGHKGHEGEKHKGHTPKQKS